jgi:hypothetical protein
VKAQVDCASGDCWSRYPRVAVAPASAQVSVDTPIGVRVGPEHRYYGDYDRPAYTDMIADIAAAAAPSRSSGMTVRSAGSAVVTSSA